MVPPLFLWDKNVPRRSDPDLSSDNPVSIVCKLGGVLPASISLGLNAGSKLAATATDDDSMLLVDGDAWRMPVYLEWRMLGLVKAEDDDMPSSPRMADRKMRAVVGLIMAMLLRYFEFAFFGFYERIILDSVVRGA